MFNYKPKTVRESSVIAARAIGRRSIARVAVNRPRLAGPTLAHGPFVITSRSN